MTGFLSTEVTVGNTGGTYNRTTEAIAFTLSSATYTGVNFGQVPANQFMTDGQKSALPGTTIYYTHQFTPGSAGQVTFTTSSASSPAGINWTQVLYQDTSSSGKIASSDPIITGPINVVAGQEICLLLKQFARTNAPTGAISKVTVTAGFTYTNATPAMSSTSTRTDLTTVGNPTTAELAL